MLGCTLFRGFLSLCFCQDPRQSAFSRWLIKLPCDHSTNRYRAFEMMVCLLRNVATLFQSSLGAGRKPLPFKKNVVALRDDSLSVTNLNQFSSHYYLLSGTTKIEGSTGSLQFTSKLCCIFEIVIPVSVLNDDRRSGQHTGPSSNSSAIHLVQFNSVLSLYTRQCTRSVWSTFVEIHSTHPGALMHYLGLLEILLNVFSS